MFHKFTGLAATLLACSSALAAGAGDLPLQGFFQSYGTNWGVPSTRLEGQALKAEAMQFQPSASNPAASVVFFPSGNLQINQLNTLQFSMLMDETLACTGGGLRITIAVEDPDNPAQTPNDEAHVYVYLNNVDQCPSGSWETLNFLDRKTTHWDTSRVGGVAAATRNQAHSAARRELGYNYRISRVRINFDGFTGTGDAWFDDFEVNNSHLHERFQDYSPEAQIPLLPPPVLGAALPSGGHFQARNMRWQRDGSQGIFKGQALHFSPATRVEDIDFMSISFFPVPDIQLSDLEALSADVRYSYATCRSGASGAPDVTILLEGSTPGDFIAIEGVLDTGKCLRGAWTNQDYLSGATTWTAPQIGINVGTNDLDAVHLAAGSTPGFENYTVYVVRLHETGASYDMWIDSVQINDAQLLERVQDWSDNPDHHLP